MINKHTQLFRDMVNKQLEPHGVTYEDVRHDPNWLHRYRFADDAAYHAWREWCITEMRRRFKWTKAVVQREFSWFDLQYGLSVTKPYTETL